MWWTVEWFKCLESWGLMGESYCLFFNIQAESRRTVLICMNVYLTCTHNLLPASLLFFIMNHPLFQFKQSREECCSHATIDVIHKLEGEHPFFPRITKGAQASSKTQEIPECLLCITGADIFAWGTWKHGWKHIDPILLSNHYNPSCRWVITFLQLATCTAVWCKRAFLSSLSCESFQPWHRLGTPNSFVSLDHWMGVEDRQTEPDWLQVKVTYGQSIFEFSAIQILEGFFLFLAWSLEQLLYLQVNRLTFLMIHCFKITHIVLPKLLLEILLAFISLGIFAKWYWNTKDQEKHQSFYIWTTKRTHTETCSFSAISCIE